jgi:hypothetical protein
VPEISEVINGNKLNLTYWRGEKLQPRKKSSSKKNYGEI